MLNGAKRNAASQNSAINRDSRLTPRFANAPLRSAQNDTETSNAIQNIEKKGIGSVHRGGSCDGICDRPTTLTPSQPRNSPSITPQCSQIFITTAIFAATE